MRTPMKVRFPTEAGNRGIRDGTLPDILRKALETVQAEAAYLTGKAVRHRVAGAGLTEPGSNEKSPVAQA